MISAEDTARPGRTVRVRTEVAALSRSFDYAVPAGWSAPQVTVGARVRVPLHGRSVRGWVVETDVDVPPGVDVVPLKSWLGWGPPPALVRLAEWAAWRWAGPVPFFLKAASPSTVVRHLPAGPPALPRSEGPASTGPPGELAPGEATAARLWARADHEATNVVRLPPATDLIDLVLAVLNAPDVVARPGAVLVLVPSTGWAERLTARLRRRGHAATTSWDEARAGWPVVVGARAGAWSPAPKLSAALVLDAHDPAYREESAPTYSAVDVAVERARRDGAPCLLVSPVPPVSLAPAPVVSATTSEERNGWARLERVDRRAADPRTGLFSPEFIGLARTVLEHAGAQAVGRTAGGRTGATLRYRSSASTTARVAPACWRARRVVSLRAAPRCGAAARRARHDDSLRCPALRRDATRRLRRLRPTAHADPAVPV